MDNHFMSGAYIMRPMTGFFKPKRTSPVVDKCYTMREAPEALRYLKAGHARGKVVVTIA
jgi:NADPH:quinone reductase-like Zn-dependent oxidoreductase